MIFSTKWTCTNKWHLSPSPTPTHTHLAGLSLEVIKRGHHQDISCDPFGGSSYTASQPKHCHGVVPGRDHHGRLISSYPVRNLKSVVLMNLISIDKWNIGKHALYKLKYSESIRFSGIKLSWIAWPFCDNVTLTWAASVWTLSKPSSFSLVTM